MDYRGKSVLIVDDSQTVIMYTSALIRRMGFHVMAAMNGADALELVMLQKPDIIILDVVMPEVDGLEVLRQLKGDTKTAAIPIIMFSIDSNREIQILCRKLGAVNYLTKPLKINELHKSLEQCMAITGAPERKYLRAPFSARVSVTHNGQRENYHAVTLSGGGIFLRCRTPLPVGSRVALSIPVKNDVTVNVKGEVIYSKKIMYGDALTLSPGMALTFAELPDETSKTISSLLQDLLAADLLEKQEEVILAKGD